MKPRTKPTRILAIDFGLARMGLALSDESKTIATPLPTLKVGKKMEENIEELLKYLEGHQNQESYSLETIVVGLPLMMSGKVGFLADEVKHFIEVLKTKVSCPVESWDERLTTVQADRSLREGSFTRKERAKRSDRVAALLILQNYLDYRKFSHHMNQPKD